MERKPDRHWYRRFHRTLQRYPEAFWRWLSRNYRAVSALTGLGMLITAVLKK
ncbi:hypothetical protein ACFW1A_14360 [Kitasatospora sp. NPDC058965]|uniref:hypothetical protein n=1 Tax=Kitasatospora sp. NPDC058965 TaxID=3346682 RepID=UPI0036AE30B7